MSEDLKNWAAGQNVPTCADLDELDARVAALGLRLDEQIQRVDMLMADALFAKSMKNEIDILHARIGRGENEAADTWLGLRNQIASLRRGLQDVAMAPAPNGPLWTKPEIEAEVTKYVDALRRRVEALEADARAPKYDPAAPIGPTYHTSGYIQERIYGPDVFREQAGTASAEDARTCNGVVKDAGSGQARERLPEQSGEAANIPTIESASRAVPAHLLVDVEGAAKKIASLVHHNGGHSWEWYRHAALLELNAMKRPIEREALARAIRAETEDDSGWYYIKDYDRRAWLEIVDAALAEIARQMGTNKAEHSAGPQPKEAYGRESTQADQGLPGPERGGDRADERHQGEGGGSRETRGGIARDEDSRRPLGVDRRDASARGHHGPRPIGGAADGVLEHGSEDAVAPEKTGIDPTASGASFTTREQRIEALQRLLWSFGASPSSDGLVRFHDAAERIFIPSGSVLVEREELERLKAGKPQSTQPKYTIGYDAIESAEACFNIYRREIDGSITLLMEGFGPTIDDAILSLGDARLSAERDAASREVGEERDRCKDLAQQGVNLKAQVEELKAARDHASDPYVAEQITANRLRAELKAKQPKAHVSEEELANRLCLVYEETDGDGGMLACWLPVARTALSLIAPSVLRLPKGYGNAHFNCAIAEVRRLNPHLRHEVKP